MSRWLITATGTGIGKTWLTAALVRALRRGDTPSVSVVNTRALKPICSGVDPAQAEGSDPALLLEALGLPLNDDTLRALCPFMFAAPLSPDMAARRENRRLTVADLANACEIKPDETLLIEGVGGVAVPINDEETTLDWFAALDHTQVLLCAGAYLGTLSHTLTALNALHTRGLDVQAVVVIDQGDGPVSAQETAETLQRHAKTPVFVVDQVRSAQQVVLPNELVHLVASR